MVTTAWDKGPSASSQPKSRSSEQNLSSADKNQCLAQVLHAESEMAGSADTGLLDMDSDIMTS